LRIRSVVATKSGANPGANSRKLFFHQPQRSSHDGKKEEDEDPLSPKDTQQVDARLRRSRERLAAAHEAKDKVAAHHGRRGIRRAKRDQRRIRGMVVAEAARAAAEAKAEAASAAAE